MWLQGMFAAASQKVALAFTAACVLRMSVSVSYLDLESNSITGGFPTVASGLPSIMLVWIRVDVLCARCEAACSRGVV